MTPSIFEEFSASALLAEKTRVFRDFAKWLRQSGLQWFLAEKALAARKKSTTFENLALTFYFFPWANFEKKWKIEREKLHRTWGSVQKMGLPTERDERCFDFFLTKRMVFRAILTLFQEAKFCKDFSVKL